MNIRVLITALLIVLAPYAELYAQALGRSVRQPIEEQTENSLRSRWLSKTVQKSSLIDDMEKPGNWSVQGIGKIDYSTERSMDGGTSLRFTTNMRDEAFIRRNAERNGTFDGATGGGTTAVLKFDNHRDWSDYNRIALWIYVHPTDMRIYSLMLSFRSDDMSDSIVDPYSVFYVQTLEPGQWNYIVWEIPNLKRKKVTEFRISQSLHGHDPEVSGIVTYDIDRIELQQVDAEKYEGWEVAPGKIAFSHAGYKPEQQKRAFAPFGAGKTFRLIDVQTERVALEKQAAPLHNEQGDFLTLDFSEVTGEGRYKLQLGNLETRPFAIADTVWRSSIYKAVNFHFCERCGYDVPTVHRVCHRDLQGIHEGEKKIVNGGWHDAADFSQGSFRTGMSIYAMMKIVEQLDRRGMDEELASLTAEEALWGLDWLLKTRFGDGYRTTWNTIRIYTDGIIGTIDDVITPANNIPWENFLASAVEAYSYEVLKDRNPRKAAESLQAAKEDWQAAVEREDDWRKNGDLSMGSWGASNGTFLTASWGITSSLHLYRASGERVYAEKAMAYADLLLTCQEREFKDGIPITGYFYTGPAKKTILHHLHAAFEESPLIALMELCSEFPGHEKWMEWYGALVLHSEYFLKRGAQYAAPFNMLPNSVFRRSEFDAVSEDDVRRTMLGQFYQGRRLTDEYYLRRFPIWGNRRFHGGTAVHLSETLALTAAAQVRNDRESESLAAEQMEWVLGKNPFSQSLMYGEGYDYLTYHAHRQRDFTGALPVGMDCLANDEPYWPGTNSATTKEIWIVPVSRYLWNAAYLSLPACVEGTVSQSGIKSAAFYNKQTGKNYAVKVSGAGTFKAVVPSGDYTIFYGEAKSGIKTVSGGNYFITLDPENYVNFAAGIQSAEMSGTELILSVEAEGRGTHSFELRLFNASAREKVRTADFGEGSGHNLTWKITVKDGNIPWTAVIIPDGAPSLKQEITGTCGGK